LSLSIQADVATNSLHKLKENKAVVFVSRREIDDGGRNCNHPVQDAFITTVQLQFII